LWDRPPFGAEIEDGVIYGRGTADAKGPIAAALEAVAALKSTGWEPNGTFDDFACTDASAADRSDLTR
jgi:acetylornithine deacetylase/succinyl-diaminopimelate desuccinylase-like protein